MVKVHSTLQLFQSEAPESDGAFGSGLLAQSSSRRVCPTETRKGNPMETFHGSAVSSNAMLPLEQCEPARNDRCLCGSGKKYKACCLGHYSNESFGRAIDAFNAHDYRLALEECRRHVTWYVLSHRAHTLPLLEKSEAAGRRMLYVDVRALSEIVSILMRCMQRAGEGSGFPLALDQLAHAIDSSLWQDKIRYFRSLWCLLEEDDRAAAARELSAIDLDECEDAEILQLHLGLSAGRSSFAERIKLVDRAEAAGSELHS